MEQTLTIQVTNVFESQVLTLTNNSVAENLPKDTLVGTLGLTDAPEGSIRYRLVSGDGASGNGRFRISGNQILTRMPFNAESQSSYSVRVQATDAAGNVTNQVFTIQIIDVNEAPTGLKLSSTTVSERRPPGTSVGQLSAVDVDAGTALTYSLVSGSGDADNSQFVIVGNSLVTAAEFDFRSRSVYSIRVRVTDEEGASSERVFRIKVTKAKESPATGSLLAWLSHLWQTNFPWWESIQS
ncbi:hypothetical protein AYO47_01165 [Planctomyces sp. SCGC AG-212-M04]|nr:hypothetical protein AYO47_01165 [Planctomyces sp. SCGC AG-212-M04]